MSKLSPTRPEVVSPIAIPVKETVSLALLHGPLELLPVSSSAHIALLPQLFDWEYRQLPPEEQKTFEVALHIGSAVGLVVARKQRLIDAVRSRDLGLAKTVMVAAIPPAVVGYRYERWIEQRLSQPRTVAAALLAGSVVMVFAEKTTHKRRGYPKPELLDGVVLGIGQATALAPGVSRLGATLTAARLRGLERSGGYELAQTVGLPVVGGAALLKGVRLLQSGLNKQESKLFALGAVLSFISTLGCAKPLQRFARKTPLSRYAAYRVLVALTALRAGNRSPA